MDKETNNFTKRRETFPIKKTLLYQKFRTVEKFIQNEYPKKYQYFGNAQVTFMQDLQLIETNKSSLMTLSRSSYLLLIRVNRIDKHYYFDMKMSYDI